MYLQILNAGEHVSDSCGVRLVIGHGERHDSPLGALADERLERILDLTRVVELGLEEGDRIEGPKSGRLTVHAGQVHVTLSAEVSEAGGERAQIGAQKCFVVCVRLCRLIAVAPLCSLLLLLLQETRGRSAPLLESMLHASERGAQLGQLGLDTRIKKPQTPRTHIGQQALARGTPPPS